MNETRFGSLELEITGLRLLDAHGRSRTPSPAPLSVSRIDFVAQQSIPRRSPA